MGMASFCLKWELCWGWFLGWRFLKCCWICGCRFEASLELVVLFFPFCWGLYNSLLFVLWSLFEILLSFWWLCVLKRPAKHKNIQKQLGLQLLLLLQISLLQGLNLRLQLGLHSENRPLPATAGRPLAQQDQRRVFQRAKPLC